MNCLAKNSLAQECDKNLSEDIFSCSRIPWSRPQYYDEESSPRLWQSDALGYMLHQLDVFGLSFGDREYSCEHFVSDGIQGTHLVIAGFQPSSIIQDHFLIFRRGAQSAQVQNLFYLLIGNMVHSGLPLHGGSGLKIEWSYTGVVKPYHF